MTVLPPRATGCTFSVRQLSQGWQVSRDETFYGDFHTRGEAVRAVSRDETFYGDFHTRGEAVRAACLGARAENQRGRRSQVRVMPADERVPHYEPHFGE